MATSSTYTSTENRNSIIRDAYIAVGQIDHDEAMPASLSQIAERKLNRIIPYWRTEGIMLWQRADASLMLVDTQHRYSLGPSTSDHWFLETDLIATEVKVAGVAADTNFDVDDTTGMVAADNIGIELDDGTVQWTTLVSITDSDTVVLTAGLTSAAAINNKVWTYTSKAQRPVEILAATKRNKSDSDSIVTTDSKADWWDYGSKTTTGAINRISYDPTTTNGTLYTYPSANNSTDRLRLLVQYPLQVFTAATDEADMPEEARLALVYVLAELLAIDFQVDKETYKRVLRKSTLYMNQLIDFQTETGESLFVEPRRR